MRTPSLRRRTTALGVVVVAALMLVFDVALYLALRVDLEQALDEVIATRLDVATGLADDGPIDQLADRLTRLGIPAIVTTEDGRRFISAPASPRLGLAPPTGPSDDPRQQVSETVGLPDGSRLEVFATTAGVNATLRQLLLLQGLLTVGGVGLAVVLLRRAADAALAPLDHVVETAERTARGATGQRLEPHDPATELGRMAIAFDHMLDELERALEDSRGAEERSARFLADAAHQLRTPIAGIRASVESLLMEEDEVSRDRLLGNVVRETARASRVLGNLLTVARLDKGRPPKMAEADLVGICRDEVERARSLAPRLEVRLSASADALLLRMAAGEIREALANLLDNARRHATAEITVDVAAVDGHLVTVTVRDDGPGVPVEAERLVFERFATLDGRGGSGLGLPIARAVAVSHGGSLVYEAGRGFVLSLPTDAPDA